MGEKKRRTRRLPDYDYQSPGAYFVTVVTEGRIRFFGHISEGNLLPNQPGQMVSRVWEGLPGRFPKLRLGAYVVMPNHFHGILFLHDNHLGHRSRGDHKDRPYPEWGKGPSKNMIDKHRRGEPGVRPNPTGQRDRPPVKPRPRQDSKPHGTQPGSLGRIVQAFKSVTTVRYIEGVREQGWPPFPGKLWQKNYYDRVIRSNKELRIVERYIEQNPLRWDLDSLNPQ